MSNRYAIQYDNSIVAEVIRAKDDNIAIARAFSNAEKRHVKPLTVDRNYGERIYRLNEAKP